MSTTPEYQKIASNNWREKKKKEGCKPYTRYVNPKHFDVLDEMIRQLEEEDLENR